MLQGPGSDRLPRGPPLSGVRLENGIDFFVSGGPWSSSHACTSHSCSPWGGHMQSRQSSSPCLANRTKDSFLFHIYIGQLHRHLERLPREPGAASSQQPVGARACGSPCPMKPHLFPTSRFNKKSITAKQREQQQLTKANTVPLFSALSLSFSLALPLLSPSLSPCVGSLSLCVDEVVRPHARATCTPGVASQSDRQAKSAIFARTPRSPSSARTASKRQQTSARLAPARDGARYLLHVLRHEKTNGGKTYIFEGYSTGHPKPPLQTESLPPGRQKKASKNTR